MGRFDGRTALITGAARGQGRSHALRLAEEGADVLALDVCADHDGVAYPLATVEDLDATVAGVRERGRRASAHVAPERAFRDQLDVNTIGVWNTVRAAVPAMIDGGRGGSVVLTSSSMGLTGRGGDGTGQMDGYVASKHAVIGLMRTWAHWLAPHHIRVNAVCPSGVETPMIMNDAVAALFTDVPVDEQPDVGNLMPVGLLAAGDVTAAVAWLASDEARYVTGVALPVDAGFTAR